MYPQINKNTRIKDNVLLFHGETIEPSGSCAALTAYCCASCRTCSAARAGATSSASCTSHRCESYVRSMGRLLLIAIIAERAGASWGWLCAFPSKEQSTKRIAHALGTSINGKGRARIPAAFVRHASGSNAGIQAWRGFPAKREARKAKLWNENPKFEI